MHAAVEADRLIKTPCRGIKLPDRPELDRHMLDAAQLSLLAAAAGPDYEPLIWLGALLGLRWGECAGLRVGRIDFLNRRLTVAEPPGSPTVGSASDRPNPPPAGAPSASRPT